VQFLGSLDPTGYRVPVMTLLFLKSLNDTFEKNADKLIQEGKSEKETEDSRNRY
jgi:type I restriction-modification system DNA methylase subunit